MNKIETGPVESDDEVQLGGSKEASLDDTAIASQESKGEFFKDLIKEANSIDELYEIFKTEKYNTYAEAMDKIRRLIANNIKRLKDLGVKEDTLKSSLENTLNDKDEYDKNLFDVFSNAEKPLIKNKIIELIQKEIEFL